MSDRIAISLSGAHLAISAAMQDANKVDEQMNSALEKAEQALDAANTGMWLGVVGGLISGADAGTSSAVPEHSDHIDTTSSLLSLARTTPAGGLHAAAVGVIDIHAASSGAPRHSDRIEFAVEKAGAADKGTTAAADARDRRKAEMDSIQHLLDLIRGMNPQI